MQETGLRNSAYGADKFGFKGLSAVHWNLTAPTLYEHAIAAGEASLVEGGPICAETGVHTGRSPKDKHTVVDALTENTVWWDGNRKITQANFQLLYDDFIAHARGKKLFAQDLYGGADPKYRIKTRVFTEFAWHSLFIRQLLIRPVRSGARGFHPRTHDRRPAVVQGRSQAPWRAHRHHHRDRFQQEDHPDRQLVLCRRDEEVGLHHAEFLSARAGRDADALLGQCRPRRRRRAVLRPLRHRQDHAVGRSEPHPHRRRRAWLGSGRRVQFRGRLLRQVHQALRGGRARDLRRHQPLRRGARERGVRSRNAHSELRRRLQDREYPLGLSARFHAGRVAHRPRRASEEHHLPDRRRLRRDAADRQAHAGAGDVSLPLRLYRQGRGHREGPGRGRARILHLLRARRSCRGRRRNTATCCATTFPGTRSTAGW